MKNKQKIIISILAAIIIIAGISVWYFQYKRPFDAAVADYKTIVEVVKAENDELDKAIANLQQVIDSGEPPYDEMTLANAKTSMESAKAAQITIGEMPKGKKEIIAKTQELNTPIDYSPDIMKLETAKKALEDSIKQLKQITNPTEGFVIERLQTISDVVGMEAVTEDNDPNKKLNKAGGYTSTVYFESKNVNQSEVYGSDIIDKGTDCGGAVEVYATKEDAEKRNNYLAAFDGGILSSGSHLVAGTLVIRTSNHLTATQQKELEQKVLNAFIELQ